MANNYLFNKNRNSHMYQNNESVLYGMSELNLQALKT